MARYIIVLLLCSILVCTLLGAGCTTPGPVVPGGSTASPTVTTTTAVPPAVVGTRVNLSEALAALNTYYPAAPKPSVRYIRATDLDATGMAQEWTIGVMRGNESSFFVYSSRGGSPVSWPLPLSYREVVIGNVVAPDQFMQSHKLFLQDVTNMGSLPIGELELVDGVYSISIGPEANADLYRFDAVSGKEIA